MTVSSDLNRITYAGNGTTTVFAVNYYFLENAHLQVVLISATGVETVQTLTANYTVSGAGNEAGGSITMLVAPPTGTTLVIQRSVPATQETDYLANDPFPAESHERALDKLTMLVQQNERDIDRALKIPLSAVGSTSTDLPIPVGNKLLAWNSDASAVTNFDPSDVITIVGQQTSYGDVFTGNGSTTNFTLTRSPGSVFGLDVSINGVTQVPNVDYILSGTTLSFTTAPPAAASKILARYAEVYQEVDADAQNVRYLPAGTGAELTNVQAKLRETVSVKDFGAVGDGVTDDTAAIQAALNTDQPLDWGGLTYRITSTVSRTYASNIYWEGRTATILYDGAHTERAVLLQGSGIEIVLNDLTIDGGKLCNKPLEILNDTDDTSTLIANNLFVTRAKRSNVFSGGDGMLIRGAFDAVTLNGGGASDCELPAGQGTSGSVGITGIAATFYSVDRYIKSMRVNGVQIEKIYSSDLAYEDDQDGLVYFTPDDGAGNYKASSELIVSNGSSFLNCYGRSVKTQCRNTIIQNSHFERTEGFTSGAGNGEIDAQSGSLSVENCVFVYDNGQEPSVCINASSGADYSNPGLIVNNCEVYLDSSVTLSVFASTFPRDGLYSRHQITNVKVFGKLKVLFDFLCRGDKNYAEVSNCFANEIVNGYTSEKALVYVRTSGTALSPYSATVTAFGNVYDNTDLPAIMRDGVSGSSMTGVLSAWNNQGFADDATVNSTVAGLKTNQVARLGRFTSGNIPAYVEVLSKTIASGATETFTIANAQGCLVFIQARFASTAYALFSSSPTTNTAISTGANFAVGNASNPGTGVFNVWSSATDEISVENTNVSARTVSVFVMSP